MDTKRPAALLSADYYHALVIDPSADPSAYEFVRPARMRQVLEETPIVFLPVGCMEYHGPHLPLGVDMLTADAICHRTAEVTGGVVLPPLWLASGVLPLPHSITVDTAVLRAAVRPILRQLAEGGFKAIIVFSGHGALDHLHVLREETDRLMRIFPMSTLLPPCGTSSTPSCRATSTTTVPRWRPPT